MFTRKFPILMVLRFNLTVEAYKKGIMKGGSAAIPPPGNIPGSKIFIPSY